MLWFRALRTYEYAMRVDEDVCLTRLPVSILSHALVADYAYGLETIESHLETVATFTPWMDQYMANRRLQPMFPPLPTDRIWFTNFFVSRVGWWEQYEVLRFLDDVNASGGIYRHRWGDAPIQSAVVRLLSTASSVVHLDVDYVHLSTHNRIVGGEEAAFSVVGVMDDHFRRLVGEAANVTDEVDGTNAHMRHMRQM